MEFTYDAYNRAALDALWSFGQSNLERAYQAATQEIDRLKAFAALDSDRNRKEQDRLRDLVLRLGADLKRTQAVNASLVDDLLFTQDKYSTLFTAAQGMVRVTDGAQVCDIIPALRTLMNALEGEPNDTQRSRRSSPTPPPHSACSQCCGVYTHHGSSEAA